ncbi:MAG: DUF2812 domain-containing protein [Oscillospiraceae bacterium]|nr:DUF2812 domain-containing protein [Oscillospiraceae bacterium]
MTQQEIQKKTQKNPYSLWDYPQLTDYLQKMALEGWMLTSYHEKTLEFQKCEPKQLKFAVSFFPDYVAGVTAPPEKLEKMWDFALMDGWQHITGNYHTQVFYNENPDCMPLHTDAVIALKNYDSIIQKQYVKRWKICAVLSGGVFVGFVVLLAAALAKFIATKYMTFWLYSLLSIAGILLTYTFCEFIFNIVKMTKYKKWYRKAQQTAKDDNDFIPLRANNFTDKINVVISALAIISIMMQFFSLVWMSAWMKEALEYVLNNPTAGQ